MSGLHEIWVAKTLNMAVNPRVGPDLIAEDKVVEVKFSLVVPGRKYPVSWTVLEEQMSYNNGRPCFWALGIYELDREVNAIKTERLRTLEKMVKKREVYLVQFDWMARYPAHPTQGKTEISQWNNTLRYPKKKDLPQVTGSYDVKGGRVHFTEGVDSKLFQIKSE